MFFSLQLNAQELLQQKLELQINQLTINEALLALSSKSGVDISYSPDFFEETQKLSFNLKEVTLEDALNRILKTTPIEFKAVGNRIILFLPNRITVGGYIEDEVTGERLISATVFDKTQNLGVITNEYGFYSLTIFA